MFWPGCANGCSLPDAPFLEVWRRTVLALRAADKVSPGKIVGPSINAFDFGYLKAFVNYTVQNDVVPDALDWHELQVRHRHCLSLAFSLHFFAETVPFLATRHRQIPSPTLRGTTKRCGSGCAFTTRLSRTYPSATVKWFLSLTGCGQAGHWGHWRMQSGRVLLLACIRTGGKAALAGSRKGTISSAGLRS